jgi:hypothetical protein
MRGGWYQVAFERELTTAVTPLEVEKPLVAVRTAEGIRVFDAICPHRGAHLGHGGRIEGSAIVCPFHARRIGMGDATEFEHHVTEYASFTVGGLVFAWFSAGEPTDLPAVLESMDRDHYFVAGFAMRAPVPAELVIENGFDSAHFQPVHEVREPPDLTVVNGTVNELRAEGTFVVPRSLWQRGEGDIFRVPYTARGLSPGIILSHLGGVHPYYVLTAATPLGRRECIIRLSLAFPPAKQAAPPDNTHCEYVLTQSRKGLEKDMVVWENLNVDAPQRLTSEDKTVIEFRRYISRFPVVT